MHEWWHAIVAREPRTEDPEVPDVAEQPPTNGTAEALRQLRDSVEKLERWQAHLGPADKLRNTLDRLDTWREESRRYWWG